MSEVTAEAKNLRVSAKKVRPILEKVKGKPAEVLLEELRFVSKKAALPLYKVLKSAIANAKQNLNISGEKLKVKEIRVDEGPTLKRFRPASRGAAHSILKRTSHIKVVLEEIN
jgi:large subunit ribosomal protein L22